MAYFRLQGIMNPIYSIQTTQTTEMDSHVTHKGLKFLTLIVIWDFYILKPTKKLILIF